MRKPSRYIPAQYGCWWWGIIDTNNNLFVPGPSGPYKLLLFKTKTDAVTKCVELNKEAHTMNKTFTEIVKDSHHCCCERSSLDWPTDTMIAEDIVDNYQEYKDVDLSDPYKYNEWVEKVRLELNRQGLIYKEDE